MKTFEGHTEPILSVRFCPFDEKFLLSSAESVKIWDLYAVNEEEQREALKGFYERWATIRHLNLHLHLHLHLHLQTMNGSISAHL